MNIDINKIFPNPEQPRKDIDEIYIKELAGSIKQHGLINPISVELVDDKYVLIDGECRWRAARLAGLTTIEASVRSELNENGSQTRLVMAIVGNVQRQNMNPIDQAQAFNKLSEAGNSIEDIAELVNLHPASVNRYLSMLKLPDEIQSLYRSGQLKNETNGLKALQSIQDRSLQINIAQAAAKNELSGPQISRLVKRMKYKRNNHEHKQQEQPKNDQHWNMIVESRLDPESVDSDLCSVAESTCKECLLYDVASHTTCKDCPAVDLLKKMCEAKKGE